MIPCPNCPGVLIPVERNMCFQCGQEPSAAENSLIWLAARQVKKHSYG